MTECWLWDGKTDKDGYARTSEARFGTRRVCRVSYDLFVGPIPAGLEIDHLCRERRCVNPEHLEAVPHAENARRAAAAITHCPKGHEYAGENLLRYGASRKCRTCNRANAKAWRNV